MLKFWDKNLTRIFSKKRDIQIADAVLELFRRAEYIELYGYDTWEKMYKFPNWQEEENYSDSEDETDEEEEEYEDEDVMIN